MLNGAFSTIFEAADLLAIFQRRHEPAPMPPCTGRFTGLEKTPIDFKRLLSRLANQKESCGPPILFSREYTHEHSHPIVFLDFDGVLDSISNRIKFESFRQQWLIIAVIEPFMPLLNRRFGFTTPADFLKIACFSADNMRRLHTLCFEHNARIVVSSSWRNGRTLTQLQNILDMWGLGQFVIAKTISYEKFNRAQQIKHWIKTNPHLVRSIVVVDDQHVECLSEEFSDQFVKTEFDLGFDDLAYDTADAKLTEQEYIHKELIERKISTSPRKLLACSA